MRKYWLGLILVLTMLTGVLGTTTFQVEAEGNPDVTLTEEQKQEISALQKSAIEKKKTVIRKYVEYGVFTEEKGQKIISHLDEYYSRLEQNDFIPKWDGSKGHKKHHHRES